MSKYKKCSTCAWLYEMRSHPYTDGESIKNKRGYACAGFLQEEENVILPGWSPRFLAMCENWLAKKEKNHG